MDLEWRYNRGHRLYFLYRDGNLIGTYNKSCMSMHLYGYKVDVSDYFRPSCPIRWTAKDMMQDVIDNIRHQEGESLDESPDVFDDMGMSGSISLEALNIRAKEE